MWKRLPEVISVILLSLLPSLPAWAHGDDDIRLDSFLGPILGLLTILVLVPIGKFVIRTVKDRTWGERS
ncbi:MAG: hypothetical protein HZA13_10505 [Nitrospirae bacterium]|nr:hypothetical protein [Nitrospirota bacterium]